MHPGRDPAHPALATTAPAPVPGEPAPADEREQLIVLLATCMARYGIPAHRLEEAAASAAASLGLQAQFFATPTAVFAAIGQTGRQRTHLLRLEPGGVSLEKLSLVDAVLRDMLARAVAPADAIRRLDEIVARPAPYGSVPAVLAFAVAAASAAVFFGGGWREVGAGAIVGLVVGATGLLADMHRRMARLIDFGAAFAAAFLATALASLAAPMSVPVVVLAGIIVLVPGLTLTTAVTELATRHLVAGTARLMGALTIFVSIGFGVAIGQHLSAGLFGEPGAVPDPLGAWAQWAALGIAPFALGVLFQAAPRDLAVILPAGVVGFLGARLGALWLGPELGVCVGAFAVGLSSNAYARLADRPAAVPTVPGLMLLVPGGLGFRSVTSFVEDQSLAGIQAAFAMMLVAVSLVAGLLLANAALAPRRPL
jgi:uncharacterized membrane protein YjjP (DUF1212 family)